MKIEYKGSPWEISKIFWPHMLLSIITLGLYHPWTKTKIRQYIASHTFIDGETMSYSGRPQNVLRGWANIVTTVLFFVIILKISSRFIGHLPFASIMIKVAIVTLVIYGYAVARYAGAHYKWLHMSWKGVRFQLSKSTEDTKKFTRVYIRGIWLSMVTVGVFFPFFKNEIHQFMTRRFSLETVPAVRFQYSNNDGFKLYMVYLKGLFFCLLTAGLYTPWFIRSLVEFRIRHTIICLSDKEICADFALKANSLPMWEFSMKAIVITFFTAGLGLPALWGMWQELKCSHLDLPFELPSHHSASASLSPSTQEDDYQSQIKNPLVPLMERLLIFLHGKIIPLLKRQ